MAGVERREKNRSRFGAEAVRHRLDLRRSLQHPHPQSAELAEQGLAEWSRGLPVEDAETLVDGSAGKPVRWVSGNGWVEER
jgi:hypothetical protein